MNVSRETIKKTFDVLVIGGGHAGVEAAVMASRMGAKTGILTFSTQDIGVMSCNPAMGGLGKGHLIREIDAMGGVMGLASDMSGIQFRMLNRTRGEAVQGPRAQIDRNKYQINVKKILSKENVEIIFDEAQKIETRKRGGNEFVNGVETRNFGKLICKALVVTTGTFLSGRIYQGLESWEAGRIGSKPSLKLASYFKEKKFQTYRLKTGTPPRIEGKSIDFKKCIVQEGDSDPVPFSFLTNKITIKQNVCFITHTNLTTHEIIKKDLKHSPLYDGSIKSKGPRYCPSIEDKVKRFADKEKHQIFLEPETSSGRIIYPNGISTSLPKQSQRNFIKSIIGLEGAKINQYGYAVEYDCVESSELYENYETKRIKGLYLAGQINGTTGYEEAAAQGLLAGINAARQIQNKQSVIIDRSNAYLGVLTSDISKGGLIEPYRMFTSRAEYRLFLRADNADERLTDLAIEIGTTEKKRIKIWLEKKEKMNVATKLLKNKFASPQTYSKFGLKINLDGKKRSAYEILGYKESGWDMVRAIWPEINKLNLNKKIEKQIKINSFYQRYMGRQIAELEELKKEKLLLLNHNVDFGKCSGLSNEIVEILKKHKPKNIGDASRLPGMTPAAAAILLRFVKK
ncbi:MAG: tRNA uridine-5-carboxymethylaminomethyl(34) synthesis enzyme MnmG [Rickettsiales bacterium]|nr:tRNA uridine-5-carboxymethylaminomethyl(34) synthesis enzyme MnmG [Rickettsiales bacterium]